jgi:histidine triad (HIT) family protein
MANFEIMRFTSILDGLLRQGALLAQSRHVRRLLSWTLTHMSFAFPEYRLIETKTLLAFYHPQPSYPLHILLTPKKPLQSLMELSPADQEFLDDLFSSVQTLVKQFDLERRGYRLIANGGPYQDFPYLHFHLISVSPK